MAQAVTAAMVTSTPERMRLRSQAPSGAERKRSTNTSNDAMTTPQVRNPFRRPDRRKQFDGMVADWNAHKGVLFHKDGGENQSNNIGNAFWRGYHGQIAAWIDADTPLHVAYVAGREVGKLARKKA